MRVRSGYGHLSEPVGSCNDLQIVGYEIVVIPRDAVFYHEAVVA